MTSTRPLILLATSATTVALTADDRLLAQALVRHEVDCRGAAWDDETVDWGSAAAVIVRSTWDYHLRRAEFLDWAGRVDAHRRLHNGADVIRWNSHKGYLAALSARGIQTIDTVFVRAQASEDVAALAGAHGWRDIVVKPAVSASAFETRRFAEHEYQAAQTHLARVAAFADVMVQPYLPGLGARGELSLVFARGGFSHAVRRRSALAEGGLPKSAPAKAGGSAIRFAERVLAAAAADIPGAPSTPPLYARADLAEVAPDSWVLLELELIEPSLFFVHAPDAADRFAALVVQEIAATDRR